MRKYVTTQRDDILFDSIINFLQHKLLPFNDQDTRHVVLVAHDYAVVNNQLIHLEHYGRKHT
jgi:hypothetical protein